MSYSENTMGRIDAALRRTEAPCLSCGVSRDEPPRWNCLHPSSHRAIPTPSEDVWPNIGESCCGKCPGSSCYVDQVTGA